VLVTGAAGFIGSALCHRLAAAGHRVIGYDDLSRGRREYLPPGVELVEADIRDGARLRSVIAAARPDWVIHLAAMHFIPDCIARPHETLDVNVEGTRCVLDACAGSTVRRVIFASSAAVYVPSDAACDEETTALGPLEVYGESKVRGEQLARRFQHDTGIDTAIVRLFNAIGRHETNPHVVPHIFESLRRSDTVELGNMEPRRDYIDTRDIADALAAIAEGPPGLQVFNVGTGIAYSVIDVIDELQRILARPIAVFQDPARVRRSERMVLLASIQRVVEVTGWRPRLSIDDTLADLVAAYGL
jgi:UDP-glucose 4-epimerase